MHCQLLKCVCYTKERALRDNCMADFEMLFMLHKGSHAIITWSWVWLYLNQLDQWLYHSMVMGNLNKSKETKPTTTTALKVAPHSMARDNLNKSEKLMTSTTTASK